MPVFGIFAILIKLSSPGPVIFKQERGGRNGKSFILLKFRTMKDAQGSPITSSGDERITGIGKFLRKTKLDEMPQFINVLKGDMSVVGPRPEIPEMTRLYTDRQKEILRFKPGITSLATIKFRNEEEILEYNSPGNSAKFYVREILSDKIECDLAYFRKRHFWDDLGIILKTIGAIFYA